MSKFKQVLEFEKKYENQINTAILKKKKKLEEFKEELLLKEEAIIEDIKKTCQNDFEKEIIRINIEGENLIKKAKDEAKFIYDNANREKIINLLMEDIKNV